MVHSSSHIHYEVFKLPEDQGHKYGSLESVKFNHRRSDFYKYIKFVKGENFEADDFIFHPTTFMGHMTLNRILTLTELYKQSIDVAGHLADVGIYKGGSSLLFAKLIKIFESESNVLCHGFDWFKGQLNGENDSKLTSTGGYWADEDKLNKIVKYQNLNNILKIHNLNLITEIDNFFECNSHIRFKLVNMDCGKYDVVKSCIRQFWDRLNKGGVMIFDQYSHELAPGETKAIHEELPDIEIKSFRNSWTPTAYAIK